MIFGSFEIRVCQVVKHDAHIGIVTMVSLAICCFVVRGVPSEDAGQRAKQICSYITCQPHVGKKQESVRARSEMSNLRPFSSMSELEPGEAPPTLYTAWTPVLSSPISPFARLIPANDAARKGFHDVARSFLEDETPAWSRDARKYIVINTGRDDRQGMAFRSKSIDDKGSIMLDSEAWTGHYLLDFGVPPADPHKGWIIADGDYQNNINSPDILLGGGVGFHGTNSPLARLVHDYHSGALTIVAPDDNAILLNGIEELRGCKRLLHQSVTSIDIGARRYKLELEPVRDSDYRRLLNKYRIDNTKETDQPPSSLMLVPSPTDQLLNQYIVKNPIGVGSTCMVHAGYDIHTGRTVAIKKFRRFDSTTFVRERERIEMVNAIGRHVSTPRWA